MIEQWSGHRARHGREARSAVAMVLAVCSVALVLTGSASALGTGTRQWIAPYSGQRGSVQAADVLGCGSATGPRPLFNLTTGKVTGSTDYISVNNYCTNPTSNGSVVFQAKDRISLPSFSGVSGSHTITVNWTLSYFTQLGSDSSNCSPAGGNPQSIIQERAWIVDASAGDHWVKSAVATQHYQLNQSGVEVAWYNLSTVSLKMHVWLTGLDSYAIWSTFGFSFSVAVLGSGAGVTQNCGADDRVGPASGMTFATLDSVVLR